jgi:hypothetical protein
MAFISYLTFCKRALRCIFILNLNFQHKLKRLLFPIKKAPEGAFLLKT